MLATDQVMLTANERTPCTFHAIKRFQIERRRDSLSEAGIRRTGRAFHCRHKWEFLTPLCQRNEATRLMRHISAPDSRCDTEQRYKECVGGGEGASEEVGTMKGPSR
ncbi:unnamed protein product [Heligmosomoides polygyrus]|uniref:CHCH domain-containing protein n=1 Tax=Heligmosomoides polygyrus TaxID=6339 RepID=A0A183FSF4_HELPZ|nr:unnamed protein product [Heligmosomoides polygyrus]